MSETSREAGYRQRCPYCDEWIEVGDEIDVFAGEWGHVDCVEDERASEEGAALRPGPA